MADNNLFPLYKGLADMARGWREAEYESGDARDAKLECAEELLAFVGTTPKITDMMECEKHGAQPIVHRCGAGVLLSCRCEYHMKDYNHD